MWIFLSNEIVKYRSVQTILLARFKMFWTIAGMSIFSVIAMMFFSGSESSLSQNSMSESMPEELTENVENYLMELYHSTINKYTNEQTVISNP